MENKDYFSSHSKIYATFRPTYPQELYDFVLQHCDGRNAAWDCGTGNGQVASVLGGYFERVFATDISAQQIAEASKAENIFYSVASAESTSFEEKSFDLITVGQALHWFRLENFFEEVRRTAKPGGVLAVWGYANLKISDQIDPLFLDFYSNKVGSFWDSARRMVEEEYSSISFPFELIPAPKFSINVKWSKQQLAGYLTSWSATQKFIKSRGYDPVPEFMSSLKKLWKDEEVKPASFPVFLKLARVN